MPLNTDKLKTLAKAHAPAVVIAALVAAAVGTVARVDDSPDRESKLASIGEALARGSAEVRPQTARNLDTRAMHEVSRAIRDADPALVDLGGQLVQPGAETVAGGNLPRGSRLVAWSDGCAKLGGVYGEQACVLGPLAAQWQIIVSTCSERVEDGENTWCQVKLKNLASVPQRALVWVRAEVTP